MIKGEQYDVGALASEAGLQGTRCGSADCARRHQVRRRKRVTDHSGGEAFENVPIVRAKFCDGATASCMPAELWRGRSTVGSVIEIVGRLLNAGIAGALEWLLYNSSSGEEPLSERTLRRWRDLVNSRLIGSALTWLGPELGIRWSDTRDRAEQFDLLGHHLTPEVLRRFRAATGRSVLDTVATRREPPHSQSRPIPGRFAPAPPPDPPSSLLRRGARSPRPGRNPPGGDTEGDQPP